MDEVDFFQWISDLYKLKSKQEIDDYAKTHTIRKE